jgi:hypothetical protein
MEAGECWMKVPMAVETNGTVAIVSMEPNETAMKVPMTMEATLNILMAVQTVV